MTMIRRQATLFLALFLSVAGSAVAQQPASPATAPVPNRTTANYDDWVVRCETGRDGNRDVKICENVQMLVGSDGRIVAQVVIGRPAGSANDRIFVELPAGVWLPDGVTIRIADKPAASLTFRRCLQSCLADADLPKPTLDALAGATQPISLGFSEGPGKPATFPLSAKGLRNAYAASNAQSK